MTARGGKGPEPPLSKEKKKEQVPGLALWARVAAQVRALPRGLWLERSRRTVPASWSPCYSRGGIPPAGGEQKAFRRCGCIRQIRWDWGGGRVGCTGICEWDAY